MFIVLVNSGHCQSTCAISSWLFLCTIVHIDIWAAWTASICASFSSRFSDVLDTLGLSPVGQFTRQCFLILPPGTVSDGVLEGKARFRWALGKVNILCISCRIKYISFKDPFQVKLG